MRFADSPTAERDIVIGVPPSAVWPLVTDFDVLARYSDEFQGGEWLDAAAAPGPGSQFQGRNRREERAWEVTCTVTAWEPDRAFGWSVMDPDDPAATWCFTLAPDGAGTHLRYRARMGPGPSGLTEAIDAHPHAEERIVERRLAVWTANMEATLAGIGALAEGGSGTG